MEQHPSNPITGFIVGSLLIVGGYFLVDRIGAPMRAQAVASAAWPTTDGRITRSELIEKKNDKGTMYSMDIAYEYVLDGRTLEGRRIWFGDETSVSSRSMYQEAVNRYPVGQAVKIHYDPAEPGVSVLEPGATWMASIWYLVGWVLMIFGGIVLSSAVFLLVFIMVANRDRDDSAGFGGSPMKRDFDRPSPQPMRNHEESRPAEDDDEDGITIV